MWCANSIHTCILQMICYSAVCLCSSYGLLFDKQKNPWMAVKNAFAFLIRFCFVAVFFSLSFFTRCGNVGLKEKKQQLYTNKNTIHLLFLCGKICMFKFAFLIILKREKNRFIYVQLLWIHLMISCLFIALLNDNYGVYGLPLLLLAREREENTNK